MTASRPVLDVAPLLREHLELPCNLRYTSVSRLCTDVYRELGRACFLPAKLVARCDSIVFPSLLIYCDRPPSTLSHSTTSCLSEYLHTACFANRHPFNSVTLRLSHIQISLITRPNVFRPSEHLPTFALLTVHCAYPALSTGLSNSTLPYIARTSQTPSNSKFIPATTPFLYTLQPVLPPYAPFLNSYSCLTQNAARSLLCFACLPSVRHSLCPVVSPRFMLPLPYLSEHSADPR